MPGCGHPITQYPASVSSFVKWNQWLSCLPINPFIGGGSFFSWGLGSLSHTRLSLVKGVGKRARAAPPSKSVLSTVINTARAEGASEAGTTGGGGGDDLHPSPQHPAREAWMPGSPGCTGLLGTGQGARRPPPLDLQWSLDAHPDHSHHLGSLTSAPRPGRPQSAPRGPKSPARRTLPGSDTREPGCPAVPSHAHSLGGLGVHAQRLSRHP